MPANKKLFSCILEPEKDIAKFWSKVKKTETCWEWVGSLFSATGYGQIWMSPKGFSAHRASWWIAFGEPGDMCVLHSCDNRKCVRPDHLFLGTRKDNMRDAIAKGRHWATSGEQCWKAKFDEKDIREIRRLHASGEMTVGELATAYKVGQSCISHIVLRINWKHII